MVKTVSHIARMAQAINRDRAKQMRHEPVAAEAIFWRFVRNRQLGGFKFRRQYPIGSYIADFVCVEEKLIVELDGALHEGRQAYDAKRDAYLWRQGYRVLRFQNEDFSGDVASTLRTIQHALETGE
jgi:very-short-patch-repair endonuclease